MVRHPAVAGSVLLIVVLWGWEAVFSPESADYAILHVQSYELQSPLLAPAAGVLLAANLAALRPYRYGTIGSYEALSLPAWRRSLALLLACVPPAVVVLLLSSLRMWQFAAADGAAGRVEIAEVVAPAVVVVLAGWLGVLGAQLVHSVVLAPVALAVLGLLVLVGLVSVDSPMRWLSLVAGEDAFGPPLPSDLMYRPAGWHLVWLSALALAVLAVALLVSGVPRRWGVSALVIALALAVPAATMQTRPVPERIETARERLLLAPDAEQRCERREQMTYCAFSEFVPYIDAWHGVVSAQLGSVPKDVAARRYAVRQRLSVPAADEFGTSGAAPTKQWNELDRRSGTPEAVSAATSWSAGGQDSFAENEVLGFSAAFAFRVVSGKPIGGDGLTPTCGGRGAVVFWLATAATEDTRLALRTLKSHTEGGYGFSMPQLGAASGPQFGSRELALGEAMLAMSEKDRPAMVRRVVAEWDELTAPSTSVEDAARLLGLPRPPAAAVDEGTCAS
ncbi:hypothetical protein [Streptomyces yerevanensis]|uniref:hypothetical protein n=1 Tax=Streptomyces yerevanensis TaxID=66378 RepID=UPI00068A77CC|nr:hypothetical protein [Streptomyces yerevanensis]